MMGYKSGEAAFIPHPPIHIALCMCHFEHSEESKLFNRTLMIVIIILSESIDYLSLYC